MTVNFTHAWKLPKKHGANAQKSLLAFAPMPKAGGGCPGSLDGLQSLLGQLLSELLISLKPDQVLAGARIDYGQNPVVGFFLLHALFGTRPSRIYTKKLQQDLTSEPVAITKAGWQQPLIPPVRITFAVFSRFQERIQEAYAGDPET